jgi:hypothetical protein
MIHMGAASTCAVPPDRKEDGPRRIRSLSSSRPEIVPSASNLITESTQRLAAITIALQSQYSRFANVEATWREIAADPQAAFHRHSASLSHQRAIEDRVARAQPAAPRRVAGAVRLNSSIGVRHALRTRLDTA